MENNNDKIILNYELPKSVNPDIFGSPFWFALHDIVDKIPCSDCKPEAVDFIRFYHDFKNYELGKKIKYKKNFIFWIKKISKLNNKPLKLK